MVTREPHTGVYDDRVYEALIRFKGLRSFSPAALRRRVVELGLDQELFERFESESDSGSGSGSDTE